MLRFAKCRGDVSAEVDTGEIIREQLAGNSMANGGEKYRMIEDGVKALKYFRIMVFVRTVPWFSTWVRRCLPPWEATYVSLL
jgi:hypothetical protein